MTPSSINAPRVKICGLREPEHADVAARAGAAYIGVVFFPPSPRAVDVDQAIAICGATPPGVGKVGLFVDATDAQIEAALRAPLDFLQLHGKETPDRVRAIREAFGLPVIKALGVGDEADVARIDDYEACADMVLCDAKPSPEAVVPGGAGESFEWRLVAGRAWMKPWMLAGGLTADNVAKAIRTSGAQQVDVSSGVESERGVKSSEKIEAFCRAVAASVGA